MKRFLAVLTALCLLGLGSAVPVLAQTSLRPVDVGNFNDYTGGGSSWDSGGSSWTYDSGGSNYYYGGSSGSSSGTGSWMDFLIGAGVVAVIIVVVVSAS